MQHGGICDLFHACCMHATCIKCYMDVTVNMNVTFILRYICYYGNWDQCGYVRLYKESTSMHAYM